MTPERIRVAVVGAGSWGTALALLLHGRGHEVALWSHESVVPDQVRATGENPFLPGVPIPHDLRVSSSLEEVLTGARLVVSVAPAQHVGSVMQGAAPHLEREVILLSASKGIEISSLRRMDEVLAAELPASVMSRFGVLSGPSFAAEVARGVPTAVVVASRNEEVQRAAQQWVATPRFRVYTSSDVTGVEVAGATKNVIALAAGVVAGLGFGHNTQAALMTRGLAEITRLGLAVGAQAETFSGLAGMGDLVLTCTGELSRNRTVGTRLAKGEPLDAILASMTAVAEGVRTAPAVHALAQSLGVEMPIVEQVHALLEGRTTPIAAVEGLMVREPKPERW
jgi:glycerol-3-phosphate dehydrogenase (NAD(P)+)